MLDFFFLSLSESELEEEDEDDELLEELLLDESESDPLEESSLSGLELKKENTTNIHSFLTHQKVRSGLIKKLDP